MVSLTALFTLAHCPRFSNSQIYPKTNDASFAFFSLSNTLNVTFYDKYEVRHLICKLWLTYKMTGFIFYDKKLLFKSKFLNFHLVWVWRPLTENTLWSAETKEKKTSEKSWAPFAPFLHKFAPKFAVSKFAVISEAPKTVSFRDITVHTFFKKCIIFWL